MSALARLLQLLSIVLFALAAGFFYAYSCSVLWGLDDAPPVAAIEAMQGINRAVRNPLFALSFFGALPAAALACLTFRPWRLQAAGLLSFGAVIAWLAAFATTVAIHVPMNQALAVVDATALGDPTQVWRDFSTPWLFWNHLRAGASTLALLLMVLAVTAAARRGGTEAVHPGAAES
ncbi:DUF1772 domain-containing protein [Marinibaculum pumilum]|uniref:DUF1772 domain-containing protein n=1 Tax=Marinibaculum pumilum TaxID=1766165 RepID=A0ABV7L3V7_9PROT